jgi:hypothetical protein
MGCCGEDEEEKKARVAASMRDSASMAVEGNMITHISRCQTDIVPLLTFLVFLFGMGYVGALAWSEGNVNRIQYGMDYRGKTCGEAELSDYTHQYWPNVLFYKQLGSICLSDCPSSPSSWASANWNAATAEAVCVCSQTVASGNGNSAGSSEGDVSTAMSTSGSTLRTSCDDSTGSRLGYYKASIAIGSTNNNYYKYFAPGTDAQLQTSGKFNVPICNPIYRTEMVMNRCIPWIDYTSMTSLFCDGAWTTCPEDKISEHFDGVTAFFEEGMADLSECKYVIAASVGIALVVGFIYLYFMKECACLVLWCGLIGTCVGTGMCTFAFYDEYTVLKDRVDHEPQLSTHDEDQKNMYICIAFACLFGVIFALVTCLVVCFCKHITVAAKLLQTAADAMLDMKVLVFYPLGQIFFLLFFCVMFIGGALLLVSAGDVVYDATYGYAELDHDATLARAFAFWLFGFFWLCEMMSAVGFMVVAFCFAMWFFSPVDPDNTERRMLIKNPICTAVKLTLCHHLGTCAFGSLIIAIIKFLQVVVEYLEKKKEEAEDAGIPCMKLWSFIFCCCRCCLWCLECCMRYINKIAYIITVLQGSNFLSSACSAVKMIIGDMAYIAIVSGISTCMLVFGKFACALVVAAICGYWAATLQVSSILFPVLVTLLIGYAIAMLFAEVYEMAVDTMLISFLYVKGNGADDHISVPESLADTLNECEEKYGSKKKDDKAEPNGVNDEKLEVDMTKSKVPPSA